MARDITIDVVSDVAALSKTPSGYSTRAMLVSWNKQAPKLDIRKWKPEVEEGCWDERASKGLALDKEEAKRLKEALESEEVRRWLDEH